MILKKKRKNEGESTLIQLKIKRGNKIENKTRRGQGRNIKQEEKGKKKRQCRRLNKKKNNTKKQETKQDDLK